MITNRPVKPIELHLPASKADRGAARPRKSQELDRTATALACVTLVEPSHGADAKRAAHGILETPTAKRAYRESTSVGLEDLPAELILHVAEYLDDVEDYRALQQTSRGLDATLSVYATDVGRRSVQNYFDAYYGSFEMLSIVQGERVHRVLPHLTKLHLTLEASADDWCLPALIDALATYSPNLVALQLTLQNPRRHDVAPPSQRADLGMLGALWSLRSLRIDGAADVGSLLVGLQGHALLQSLSLCASVLEPATASLLRNLPLHTLELRRVEPAAPLDTPMVSQAAMSEIAACTDLETLYIEACEGEGIDASLRGLTKLQTLRLPHTVIGDGDFLAHLQKLERFEVYGMESPGALESRADSLASLAISWDAGDALAMAVGSLTKLMSLTFGGLHDAHFGSLHEGVDMPAGQVLLSPDGLGHFRHLRNLRELVLKNHALQAGSLSRLLPYLSKLDVADFSGNDIDVRDVEALGKTPVTSLCLRYCELGQQALSRMGCIASLEHLEVSKNDLSECVLNFDAPLTKLKKLIATDCDLKRWPADMLSKAAALQVLSLCYNDFDVVDEVQSRVVTKGAARLDVDLDNSLGMAVVFPHLSELHSLRTLSVCDTDVTHELFTDLAANPPPALAYIVADDDHAPSVSTLLTIPSIVEVVI